MCSALTFSGRLSARISESGPLRAGRLALDSWEEPRSWLPRRLRSGVTPLLQVLRGPRLPRADRGGNEKLLQASCPSLGN